MKVEETLQYMADFYPDIFPTRKHALNHLFCVVGNGFKWMNGELVDESSGKMKRYKLIKPIKKAVFDYEDEWYRLNKKIENTEMEISTTLYLKYSFSWDSPSKSYSKLFNYPKDIKSDWLAAIDECKQLLIADEVDIENCED